MTKFWDRQIRPPRGGWHFNIGGALIERYSEPEILNDLRNWQKNNGTFTSDADLEAELWNYYCAREPSRCGGKSEAEEVPTTLTPREVTKTLQGPPIWTFLNTLAVQWRPELADYFLATCDAIASMLVCPECRAEWTRILTAFPPLNIGSKADACHWVNTAHNAVNSHADKPNYPYERMVREWGAPIQ